MKTLQQRSEVTLIYGESRISAIRMATMFTEKYPCNNLNQFHWTHAFFGNVN